VSELFFTRQHEWVRFHMGKADVGLTGKDIVGDMVYVELPEVGRHVEKGEACAAVESVKTMKDVHTPVAGVVSAINDTVYDDPDMIVKTPLETWLFRVDYQEQEDTSGLLDAQAYRMQ
jgi:glycine cleavage system H protein